MIRADRRQVLLGGIAATMSMSPVVASARNPRGFFDRVGLPIGLQLYTLGDDTRNDLDATFAAVAEIGYRDIELPNLYGRSPADIRAAAAKAGLGISSLHVPAKSFGGGGLSLASPAEQVAETLHTLGAKRAAVPIAPFPDNFRRGGSTNVQAAISEAFAAAGADIWKRSAALLNESAAALQPLGIRLGYHNHNIEFAPIGSTTGWDILLAECSPSLVDFEIDVGWIATAGLNPAAFLARHKGRVTQLHVKDVSSPNPVNFALSMQPAEVGSGTLDWARILPAAHEAGVRHFYVEQEPPFAIPRVEAIRKSFAFLSKVRA